MCGTSGSDNANKNLTKKIKLQQVVPMVPIAKNFIGIFTVVTAKRQKIPQGVLFFIVLFRMHLFCVINCYLLQLFIFDLPKTPSVSAQPPRVR